MSTEQKTEVTTQAQAPEQAPTEVTEVEASSEESQGEEQLKASDAKAEAEGDDAEAVEEKPKKKSGIQRLKERHAREMAAIHREIEQMKAQAQGKREADQPKSEKPRADQFETHEDYVEALTDWKLEQRERLNAEKSKEAEAKSAFENRLKAHNERVAKFKAQNPDYEDTIEEYIEEHGDMHFSFGLQEAILESEDGPALILELAKDPETFKRLNGLSITAAAREIGKLEAKLAKETTTKEVKLTKAPKPPTPIQGKSAPVRKSIHDEDISFADYVRLRRDSERKKA